MEELNRGDRARHELLFQELRAALYDFFRWRGHLDPDEAAQEALLRLHEKMVSEDVTIANARPYVFGIAQHLLVDSRRKTGELPIEDIPEHKLGIVPAIPREAMLVCLEQCIEGMLSGSQGKLLPKYFCGHGAVKIENRKKIAEQLGITPAALRLRVSKLIRKIRPCVMECCAADRHKLPQGRLLK